MVKDKFSKLFLVFFILSSTIILIMTENYKYLNSKTFFTLFIMNILFVFIFFLKKFRFIIYVNFCIFFLLIFFSNLFLYLRNPAQISTNQKYEFIKKNKLYPDVPPITHLKEKNLALLPLSGLSKVYTVTTNESGYWDTFYSDEYGFNNDIGQHEKVQKSKNKKLIFLGDSMTMGSGVYRNENFVSLINNNNKDIDALNLGYGGNSFLLSLATYREYGKNIKNAKVFFCYYEGNDFFEFELEEKKSRILTQYFDKDFSQNLLNQNQVKDEIVKQKIEKEIKKINNKNDDLKIFINEIIKLGQIRKMIGILNNKKEYYAFNDNNFLQFDKVIKILKREINESESELIFIYVPAREHFFWGNPYKEPYKTVLKIINKNNIKIIDLYEELSKSKNPLTYYPYGVMRHFNVKGHKKIYDIIINKI